MTKAFERYVGIDWSGDKKPWQKGLKVAVAYPGREAPHLEPGPGYQGRWTRTEAVSWIESVVERSKALIGLDFAFGFPSVESFASNVWLDWDYVEGICAGDPNFYGGAFFRTENPLHSHLVNSPWLPKRRYSADHLRLTEKAAMETKGARPQSIFNAVGAAQVGPSSISGMRALRHLRFRLGEKIDIWPFDERRNTNSMLVEVFPRYFPLSKGLSPKLADHSVLNLALEAFDSDPVQSAPKSEDEGDAILCAAALRLLSADELLFDLPDQSAKSEGWIYGVRTVGEQAP